jgi:ubiquinone/menaquinone biosynthesis C-methylase UbiE
MSAYPEKSYERHAKTYSENPTRWTIDRYRNFYTTDTIDLWRHTRMMQVLRPFLELEPRASWLTVGDGNFGTAAMFIERFGAQVLATDIDTTRLKIAKEEGMINKFAMANAEYLPFPNEHFDYTFCKEAYHHFPRPPVAWYEMLRVSKRALLFSEPADWVPPPLFRKALGTFKRSIKKVFGRPIPHRDAGSYEPTNYVYTISVREFEKMALAIDLPCLAYKRIHDVYIPGVENQNCTVLSTLYLRIRLRIAVMSLFKLVGLGGFNRIQIIVFKEMPSSDLINSLRDINFKVIMLPMNPFM